MKKTLVMAAFAALLSAGAVKAMPQDMAALSATAEMKDEKKDEKKNPDDIVMVIELDAHTDVILPRAAVPAVGAGLTSAGLLKVWSDVPVQALIRVTDAAGTDAAVAGAVLAPGMDACVALDGMPSGSYTLEVSLSDGQVLSGTFII